MKITMKDKTTAIVEGVKDFNLTHTFMCGQCFRWHENPDGTYTGIANGRAVTFALSEDVLTIYNTSLKKVNPACDYNIFKSTFDINLNTVLGYHKGEEEYSFLDDYNQKK